MHGGMLPIIGHNLGENAARRPSTFSALIIMGAAVLGYDHYRYTSVGKILEIGPITASADKTHPIALPPILG